MRSNKITYTLSLPGPHSKHQNLVMNAFMLQNVTEIWVACGTKFGKSIGAATSLCASSFMSQNRIYRWVAPIYSQAKIGYRYCRKFLPPGDDFIKEDRGNLTITLLKNDSFIEFRSGKYPEDLEGEGVTGGYVLDECAKLKEEVYSSCKTTLSITRAPMLCISTPRGKNWFYRKCMEAKEEMKAALREQKEPTKIFMTAPSIVNPSMTKESIEDAKKSLPDRLFRQYYLAEFMDDGGVFVGFSDCFNTDWIETSGQYESWIREDAGKHNVVIGADWAKHEDFTVFTAFSTIEPIPTVVGFLRFQNVKYTHAIKLLRRFCKNFNEVCLVKHDKTGVGEVIDEMLIHLDIPFEGVVFNNNNKAEMVNQLIVAFEKKAIALPRIDIFVEELEAFEVKVSSSGNMKYAASAGFHDDTITSLMLGFSACLEYSGSFEIRYLEDLPKTDISIEKYYEDIMDDDFE